MKPVEATMTSKGQLTVPASLRRALGLKAGDKLVFKQDAAGRFLVEARTDTLADLRGIVTADDSAPITGVDSGRVERWIDEARGARWFRARPSDPDRNGET